MTARNTYRVAISNSRLIAADAGSDTFRWRDYRRKGRERQKTRTLQVHEFIRRSLLQVLPHGLHRVRQAGFLANGVRRKRLQSIRQHLKAPEPPQPNDTTSADPEPCAHRPCPECDDVMSVIETFARGQTPRSRDPPEG